MTNQRDDQGWRIPKPGTCARQVYDLVISGYKQSLIAKKVGISKRLVDAILFQVRHPEQQNEKERVNRIRRKLRDMQPTCTYCQGTEWYIGPSGGLSTNILCSNKECRHWFNYTPVLDQLDDLKRVEPAEERKV